MDTIRVVGCPPYDGDYDFDGDTLTNRELRTIKQVSGGLRGRDLRDALQQGDQDAYLAITYIAIQRSGKFEFVSEDILLDAQVGAFEYIENTTDDEDAPASEDPSSLPPSEPPSEPADANETSSENEPFGAISSDTSDAQVLSLPPTGTQG